MGAKGMTTDVARSTTDRSAPPHAPLFLFILGGRRYRFGADA
jgi:hypothetical protein